MLPLLSSVKTLVPGLKDRNLLSETCASVGGVPGGGCLHKDEHLRAP